MRDSTPAICCARLHPRLQSCCHCEIAKRPSLSNRSNECRQRLRGSWRALTAADRVQPPLMARSSKKQRFHVASSHMKALPKVQRSPQSSSTRKLTSYGQGRRNRARRRRARRRHGLDLLRAHSNDASRRTCLVHHQAEINPRRGTRISSKTRRRAPPLLTLDRLVWLASRPEV